MKILVLCYEYPPIGGGGGRAAQSIAEALEARGHEVRVQTAGMSHLPARETIRGVEIFRTPSFRRREDTCAVHEMGLFVATSFLPTLRHIARWQPDVIHAHFAMPTGLLAWVAHWVTGVPYVLTAHLGDVPGALPQDTDTLFKMIDPIARRVWQQAAAVTAVSEFVSELAVAAYDRPVEKILNGIDLADRPEKPVPAGSPPHLLFIGRFNPQKNLLFLIDALARLRDLDWTITVIGDGPQMLAVRERLAETGLQERARVTGWLKTPEVHAILREADALVMPSSVEGMPVAAVEALKFGLAIVGSAIPGLRDVASPENALLLPVGDVKAFASGLRALIGDPARFTAMKAASHEKARDFDLAAITSQYESVLQSAADFYRGGRSDSEKDARSAQVH